MLWVRRLVFYPLSFLLVVIVVYVSWALVVFRDIPYSALEEKYGGDNLQRLTVDGVSLAYKVEGEGPALLLIHSHFYTMRFWQAWVDQLQHNYKVIRFDMTSHGLTGPDPTHDYSPERAAVLIDALLLELGVDRASIAGSSSGGAIGFHFAATRPDKVDKLVLLNTPGMPRITNKAMEYGLPSWGGFMFYLLPTAIFKPFLQAAVVDKSVISDQMVLEFHEMFRGEGNRMAEYRRMSTWRRSDPSPVLSKITAPTLIMWGEKNPQLPVEHVGQFKARLSAAARVETIIYPNIGHVIPVENPGQSVKDVEKFLN